MILTKFPLRILIKQVNAAIDENSEFRYFNKWNTSGSTMGNSGTYKIEFKLNFSKERIIFMESELDKKTAEIISKEINSNMSDYEKELHLHDYLVNNAVYDYQNFIKATVPDLSYTAYGVLVGGIGVCEGYAYSMKRLLTAVGIISEVVTGEVGGDFSGAHAWNIVKLGRDYYQLDPTFDDPVVNNGTKNILSHSYFNLTDEEMSKNHSWLRVNYPICNSTTYKYSGK